MTLYSYRAPFDQGFKGNPNISITAIDESGGIVCSQTSGQIPCFVQASASAILATGTSEPYEDLYYTWDFGDASSAETFTNPGVGGGTVNSNDDQRGPEAVHCYRSAGTYTITLRIRGARASSLVNKTVTQQIVVSAFDKSGGEYWADSAHGGTNAGTEANPYNTFAAIKTALQGAASQVALHVKRGSVFDAADGVSLWSGSGSDRTGLRIDAYGTGANPSFVSASGTGGGISMNNGAGANLRARNDVVISNIDIATSDTNTSGAVVAMLGVATAAAVSKVFMDNCTFDLGADTDSGSSASKCFMFDGNDMEQIGLWNCTSTCALERTEAALGQYIHADQWAFVVGGSIYGGTDITAVASGRDHHMYMNVQKHVCIRWVDFQAGTNRNYCINGNWDHVGASLPEYAEFWLIADCGISGVQRFHDMGENLNDPTETLFRNIVSERCRINGLGGDGYEFAYCVGSYTFRDHEIWNCDGGRDIVFSTNVGSLISFKMYRNKRHRSSTAAAQNLYDFASALWTTLFTITDNITVDERSTSRAIAIPFTQQTGATIDRNQWYFPNDGGANGLRDVTTEKTFAQWQAAGFDTNGSVADPGWTDPANGDFS